MATKNPKFITTTRKPTEWFEAADKLAKRVVNLSAQDAWSRVCAGQYEGTPFAAELSQLMSLAGEDQHFSHAAE